ncbi:MAG: RNA methyltransferase [Acidobacteriota bacterium]|nr:RNA methyltransferase [Acidobacteriota bacterium]
MKSDSKSPVVILVAAQLGENIGASARAMLNCGLDRLRLVRPRHGWPNPHALPSAAGADRVLETIEVFDTTAEAVADVSCLYATTARLRDMIKPVLDPRAAAFEARGRATAGEQVGWLFGPERAGLDNADVVAAHRIVHVPLNPEYASLNLAQAVLLMAYEWRMAEHAEIPKLRGVKEWERAATQAELDNFFNRLETSLDAGGFFEVPEKRPSLVRNIRNVFTRAQVTNQEVRTLHGIITALLGKPGRPDKTT